MDLDMYDAEVQAKLQLAELHREYTARAQPLIDLLVKIESLRTPKPLIIYMEQLVKNSTLEG